MSLVESIEPVNFNDSGVMTQLQVLTHYLYTVDVKSILELGKWSINTPLRLDGKRQGR